MRPAAWMGWIGLLLMTGCDSEVSGESLARLRFEAFQTALLEGDQSALRRLVCSDARPAIREMCLENRSGQRALSVTGVTRRSYEYLVHFTDPNHQDRASYFVLCVEDGAMRVDLRATHRDHTVTKRRFLAEGRFVPQRLSPEQIERARVVHTQQAAKAAPTGR